MKHGMRLLVNQFSVIHTCHIPSFQTEGNGGRGVHRHHLAVHGTIKMEKQIDLVEKADQLYAAERYGDAYEQYEAAAMLGSPTSYLMAYLVLSSRSAESSLLTTLLVRYPDSIIVQKAVASASLQESPASSRSICTN